MKNNFFALTFAVAALAGCSPRVDTNPETSSITASNVTLTAEQRQSIHLYTVAVEKYHRVIDADGTVDFDQDQSTSVLAPFGGPVTQLLVSPGDLVKAGDSLAIVNSPDFAAAVSAYRKAIITAKTDRDLADLDKRLLEHHGVAQKEAAQAESDAVNAEADRDAALQALVSLNVDPQTIKDIQDGKPVPRVDAPIRSPIAGTVVEKLINPGLLLQAGTTPCFTIADLSKVWVLTHLFGADYAAIHPGDTAEIETGAGTNTVSGKVDNIAAEVDPDTRAVTVRVVVDNPGDVLKRQMYVRVHLQSAQENSGLLAPVSAVLRDDENLPFVYVVQPDGSYARRHVTLGARTGDQYEIPAGLNAGDQVVVDGGIFIQFVQNQ